MIAIGHSFPTRLRRSGSTKVSRTFNEISCNREAVDKKLTHLTTTYRFRKEVEAYSKAGMSCIAHDTVH